jgi:gliding motility-associated-like protein
MFGKHPYPTPKPIGLLMLLLYVCTSTVKAQQLFPFAALKGNPVDTSGWDFLGTAAALTNALPTFINPDEVLVCAPELAKSGGVFYRRPINIVKCSSWEVTFEFSLRGPIPGDGLAFCFLDKTPLANQLVLGEGMGIPQDAQGLKICIDTYNNSNDRNPGPINNHKNIPMVQIRWGKGYPVYSPYGSVLSDGTQDDLHGDNRNFKQPSKFNDDKSLDFLNIGTNNPQFHRCRIVYNNGNVQVYIGNMVTPVIQTTIPLAEQPSQDGFFGFTSSTGGNVIAPFVRNVNISTNLPIANPGANKQVWVCSGLPVVLGTAAQPGITYQWSPGNNLNNTSVANPTFLQTNFGPDTITQRKTLLVSNSTQVTCQSADSIDVKVLPAPSLSFGVSGSCVGEILQFTPSTGWPNNLENTLQFKWRFGDTLSTPANPDSSMSKIGTHAFSKPGIYTVVLETKTPAGCFSKNTGPVNIQFGSNAAFSVTDRTKLAFCKPVKLVQQKAGGGAGSITIFPDYPSATKVEIKPTIPVLGDTIAINYQTLGIVPNKAFYVIKWVTLDASGCQSQEWDTIYLSPLPNVNFSPLSGICVNAAPINLTAATETTGVPGIGWYKGHGITDSALGTFNPALVGVGKHTITYHFLTALGCSTSASQSIEVHPTIAVNFSVLNRGSLCFRTPVVLQQNAVGGMAGQTKIYYDFPASPANSLRTPIPQAGTAIALHYPSSGIASGKPFYVVRWENISDFGCQSFKQDSIIIAPNPITQMVPLAAVCADAPPFLLNSGIESSGAVGQGIYTGKGILNSNGLFDPSSAQAGAHRIQYIFTANTGCADTSVANQTVYTAVLANGGPTRFTFLGVSTQILATTNVSNYAVLWTPSLGLSNPTELRPKASPSKDQLYTIAITSAEGCSNSDTVSVRVIDQLIIPNAFSPNGDGINDTWQIRYLDLLPEATIQIFDRYGKTVLNKQGYNPPWDGRVNGRDVPVGVYYYIIDLKIGGKIFTGSIAVLR